MISYSELYYLSLAAVPKIITDNTFSSFFLFFLFFFVFVVLLLIVEQDYEVDRESPAL